MVPGMAEREQLAIADQRDDWMRAGWDQARGGRCVRVGSSGFGVAARVSLRILEAWRSRLALKEKVSKVPGRKPAPRPAAFSGRMPRVATE
jgi:hypothetical protein